MPTHGCISCPDRPGECCICKGHQHGVASQPVFPPSRCLMIVDRFDEPHRCLNHTDGFKAYCDVHMPLLRSEAEYHRITWKFWAFLVVMVCTWGLGFWVRDMLVPWSNR